MRGILTICCLAFASHRGRYFQYAALSNSRSPAFPLWSRWVLKFELKAPRETCPPLRRNDRSPYHPPAARELLSSSERVHMKVREGRTHESAGGNGLATQAINQLSAGILNVLCESVRPSCHRVPAPRPPLELQQIKPTLPAFDKLSPLSKSRPRTCPMSSQGSRLPANAHAHYICACHHWPSHTARQR